MQMNYTSPILYVHSWTTSTSTSTSTYGYERSELYRHAFNSISTIHMNQCSDVANTIIVQIYQHPYRSATAVSSLVNVKCRFRTSSCQTQNRALNFFTARQHSAVLAIVNLSDRLTDRPSHAGIMPKRLKLRSRGLHWRIAP